ncbi:PAS domain S-box protein [Qipengyuania sp. 6B39]|uniref:GAF domain-containing protein n=1 Tax=Qipengyuania proteolytica TaxID=2867239 RepID=UPI001C88E24E|nr:GAF domain-containing protein [Qipengyuania proteolytica]MBX7494850.1 PAS domain S-box protein [Qipengyuania proteolytica]
MLLDTPTTWPPANGPNPAFCGEQDRLTVMASYGLDELENDPELRQIVQFAAKLCGAPISLVSLVEEQRQRFLARAGLQASETPRPTSFCAHAMMEREPMVVPDALLDPRFERNPLVTGEPKIRFYAGAPLLSSEGAPLGSLCVIDTEPRPAGLTEFQREGLEVLAASVMRRLNARREYLAVQEKLVRESLRLRRMAEHIPVLAWAARPDGSIEFGNEAFYEYCGTSDVAAIDLESLVHEDQAEFVAALRANSRATEKRWEAEARLRRADGEYRWMVLRAWPMRDAQGNVETWFGAGIDIDETHRLSESNDLLARELSHRIKNIFAVISGLIAIRSRGKPELTEFASELGSAIRALGTAHDYVRPDDGPRSENLQGLLRDLLRPYGDGNSQRFEIAGDDIEIGPRAATPLALIFHELATNSAKYGALTCDDGAIGIAIAVDGETDGEIRVTWRETMAGECETLDSEREGFGSRLLRMAVESQLGGRFVRDLGPEGMLIELAFPKAKILP